MREMLQGKKILLGLSGGIAVYKAVDLASQLTKNGAIVKTIMTTAAMEFVTPLTFRSITHESVTDKLFNSEALIEHISLAEWADLMVIAPATADIIGKIANGIADDLLTTTILATKSKKLVVPAMNVNMYENPILQANLLRLKEYGFVIMEPEEGLLACGSTGKGRFPAVEEIMSAICSNIYYDHDLYMKKILITVGATRERIDPMRYISNFSSGKMGLALARSAYFRGAQVTVVYGSVQENLPYYTHNIQALSALEMFNVVIKISKKFDVIIGCAAVADFTPAKYSEQKIKKDGFPQSINASLHHELTIDLQKTKDLLFTLGKQKKSTQYYIGFAAESENHLENGYQKMSKKNLDLMVVNDLSVAGESNSVIRILSRSRENKILEYQGSKPWLAHKILECIL